MYPPIADRAEIRSRLSRIFPDGAADRILRGDLAAAAIFALAYVGAVPNDTRQLARPTMVLWMDDAIASRTSDADRTAYFHAALRGRQAVATLTEQFGTPHRSWYADNSRETLRDEILPKLMEFGAVLRDQDVPTTSSKPRWALDRSFVALFDPKLRGDDLDRAITSWQSKHLTARAMRQIALDRLPSSAALAVTLPDGAVRHLAPGRSSAIVRGVLEEWAPRRLAEPKLLFISESGNKLDVVDAAVLQQLRISLDVTRLLPDLLLYDRASARFWFVEIVATNGVVDERRRRHLLAWAAEQEIEPHECQFLTAFESRSASIARKRLAALAVGSHAWFLDEPAVEMSIQELQSD